MVHLAPQLIAAVLTHLTALRLSLAQYHRVSLRELLALGFVGSRGEASLTALHQSLSIPKSAVTALVDRLHARGMVERRQDQLDRRRWFVSLTPSGQHLMQEVEEEEARLVQDALKRLPESEQEAFLKALHGLKEQFIEARPTQPTQQEGNL
jgi:DNA-binding MarR family transcriptional regulator